MSKQSESKPRRLSVSEMQTRANPFFKAGDFQSDTCTICLERYTEFEPAMVFQCGHAFHVQCVMQWRMRSRSCPLCWERLEEAYLSTLDDAMQTNKGMVMSASQGSMPGDTTPLMTDAPTTPIESSCDGGMVDTIIGDKEPQNEVVAAAEQHPPYAKGDDCLRVRVARCFTPAMRLLRKIVRACS